MATKNFRVSAQMVIGFVVIILGVFWTLENMGILYAREYLRLWPAFIALYGIVRIVQGETVAQKSWGVFWTLVGTLWVLDRLYLIDFSIWDLWPLVLIVLGISMILGKSRGHRGFMSSVGDSNNSLNAFAMMGSYKRRNDSQDFQGGEITAIMGGCEIDLRKASIKESEAILNLVAIMGGIELWVPEDWNVTLQGIPILGGFDDKTYHGSNATKNLVLRGYAVMGGVDIKN